MDNNTTVKSEAGKYEGVDGWLLFLYLKLFYFAPLVALISLYSYFKNTYDIHISNIFYIVLYIGMTIFGMVCGRLLWNKNIKGVRYGKIYFIILIIMYVIDLTIPIVLNEHVNNPPRSIYGLIISVICYVYLIKSKRVKATYKVVSKNDEKYIAAKHFLRGLPWHILIISSLVNIALLFLSIYLIFLGKWWIVLGIIIGIISVSTLKQWYLRIKQVIGTYNNLKEWS
jgi:hypothetical protein